MKVVISEKNQMKRAVQIDQAVIRQDALILADAWLALWKAEESHCLDTSQIDVKVCGCKLVLSGWITDMGQLRLAECLMKAIVGVSEVHNVLVINS